MQTNELRLDGKRCLETMLLQIIDDMYKKDLALSNRERLICHKTRLKRIKPTILFDFTQNLWIDF